MNGAEFKMCKVCQKSWASREEFIADNEIMVIGYQVNSVNLGKGLFLFNHSCDGTLSIQVEAFADLYMGPIYTEKKLGSESCPGYCQYQSNLKPCPEKCECNFVRVILQILAKPAKNSTEALVMH